MPKAAMMSRGLSRTDLAAAEGAEIMRALQKDVVLQLIADRGRRVPSDSRITLKAVSEATGINREDFVFPSRIHDSPHLGTRQYARILEGWVEELGLDPADYGTHSMRRTKATLIYRRTRNPRAVQLLLGHSKLDYLPRRTMSRGTHRSMASTLTPSTKSDVSSVARPPRRAECSRCPIRSSTRTLSTGRCSAIGTICVFDPVPHRGSPASLRALEDLALIATAMLRARIEAFHRVSAKR